MDVAQGGRIFEEQTVKGIGKHFVGLETNRAVRFTDEVQPRMGVAGILAPHGIQGKATGGHGDQQFVLQAHQGRGIVGNDLPEGLKQPLITIFGAQGGRQVCCDGEQYIQRLHSCYLYNIVIDMTTYKMLSFYEH